jgi:hypothetical protein
VLGRFRSPATGLPTGTSHPRDPRRRELRSRRSHPGIAGAAVQLVVAESRGADGIGKSYRSASIARRSTVPYRADIFAWGIRRESAGGGEWARLPQKVVFNRRPDVREDRPCNRCSGAAGGWVRFGPIYRSRRMSTSRSTKRHSSVARSIATSSSNAGSSAGANSNHVRKSNDSPRSRLWWRRRATAGT